MTNVNSLKINNSICVVHVTIAWSIYSTCIQYRSGVSVMASSELVVLLIVLYVNTGSAHPGKLVIITMTVTHYQLKVLKFCMTTATELLYISTQNDVKVNMM